MRSIVMMALALSSLTAHAGGIGFEKKYVGTHPFAQKTITLEFTDSDGLKLNVQDTVGNAEKLVLKPVSRNSFETIFNLTEGEQDDAAVVAKVVTTGDCQQVQTLALVYPSGVSATLKAVPEKRILPLPAEADAAPAKP